MSTISQLTEYSFRRLIRQDAETRLKNQEALKYIIELSQNTRTDISRWDIQAIFGTKTNHFVQDKTEINKRFFAAKESQQIVSNTATE